MSYSLMLNENPFSLVNKNIENCSISFRVPVNLGDTVIFTIFIKQFRETYPNVFIIVDGHRTFNQEAFDKNIFSELLIGNPNIDLLILKPEDFLKLRNKPLVKFHFHMDILMIQQCFLGAWREGAHEADLFCDVVGIPRPPELSPTIYLENSEIYEGKITIDKLALNKNKKPILIQAEAINPLKQWPKSNWEQLVKILKDKYEIIQVGIDPLWKIPGTISLIENSYSLRQIAALAYNSERFIGIDSGIHHVCRAVGSKCIVIAPSIYPKSLWAYPEDIVLIRSDSEYDCAYCEQNRFGMAVWELSSIPEDMNYGKYCCTKAKCIESITVEEVTNCINNNF